MNNIIVSTKPGIIILVHHGDSDASLGNAGKLALRGQQEMHFVGASPAEILADKSVRMHSSSVQRCRESADILRKYLHISYVENDFLSRVYSPNTKAQILESIEKCDCESTVFVCHEPMFAHFPRELASRFSLEIPDVLANKCKWLAVCIQTDDRIVRLIQM